MPQEQGQKANQNGKWLEDQVESILSQYDVESVRYSELARPDFLSLLIKSSSAASPSLLVKNVPYTNMFGKNARGEFLILSDKLSGPTRIECRYQAVRGSVEDKLPKLLGDCLGMEAKNVIIVLEGVGVSPEAKQWLKSSVHAIKHKNILVMTLGQFRNWVVKVFSASEVTEVIGGVAV